MEGGGESKQQRTDCSRRDQVRDEMLDQGVRGVTCMLMAEMMHCGHEDACQESHDGGQGDAPRLA